MGRGVDIWMRVGWVRRTVFLSGSFFLVRKRNGLRVSQAKIKFCYKGKVILQILDRKGNSAKFCVARN